MEDLTLDDINALPPQLLADMRSVRIGMDDPNNPSHRQLREFMNKFPGKFLEQMNGLEKAYQGQIGRQKASKSALPESVGKEDPVEGKCPTCGQETGADRKEEKVQDMITRLRKEWGDETGSS